MFSKRRISNQPRVQINGQILRHFFEKIFKGKVYEVEKERSI